MGEEGGRSGAFPKLNDVFHSVGRGGRRVWEARGGRGCSRVSQPDLPQNVTHAHPHPRSCAVEDGTGESRGKAGRRDAAAVSEQPRGEGGARLRCPHRAGKEKPAASPLGASHARTGAGGGAAARGREGCGGGGRAGEPRRIPQPRGRTRRARPSPIP